MARKKSSFGFTVPSPGQTKSRARAVSAFPLPSQVGGLQLLLTGLLAVVVAVLGLSPLLHQLLVQFPELLQEAPVGEDTAVLGHLLNGVHQGHVPVDHQVGQDQGRRAAAAHDAVNQDLI